MHTYVIQLGTTINDQTTVTGTVDGVAFVIQVWHSQLVKFPNATAVQNFLAPLALAAAFPLQPIVDVTVPLGTFVQ